MQEESKKAKQVHQQIQQDKHTNAKLAQFLSFLLGAIKDEKLVSILYELFFKTKNTTTGTTYLRKKINILVIIGFSFPFYIDEAKNAGIEPLFDDLLTDEPFNLTGYINYVKRLSAKHHDNIALDAELLITFLLEIISYYKLYEVQSLDEEQYKNFVLQIKNELYT